MIMTTAHLSYLGFMFDGQEDMSRQEVEHFLRHRHNALKPSVDYIIQPMMNGWQLSGITPQGARAACIQAQAMKIIPNRIDVSLTCWDVIPNPATDYNVVRIKLNEWFSLNRPKMNINQMLPLTGNRKTMYGARNSRWCLTIEDGYLPYEPEVSNRLTLTFLNRADNAKSVWSYFVGCGSDSDFEYYSREAFAACTNTFLGPDFFGLHLPDAIKLVKEKPDNDNRDWYSYLSSVAGKMANRYVNSEDRENFENDMTFLEKEYNAQLARISTR